MTAPKTWRFTSEATEWPALIGRARRQGWPRLYRHTEAGNPARRLYDHYVRADDLVRYQLAID
jgi:hypothetical protein